MIRRFGIDCIPLDRWLAILFIVPGFGSFPANAAPPVLGYCESPESGTPPTPKASTTKSPTNPLRDGKSTPSAIPQLGSVTPEGSRPNVVESIPTNETPKLPSTMLRKMEQPIELEDVPLENSKPRTSSKDAGSKTEPIKTKSDLFLSPEVEILPPSPETQKRRILEDEKAQSQESPKLSLKDIDSEPGPKEKEEIEKTVRKVKSPELEPIPRQEPRITPPKAPPPSPFRNRPLTANQQKLKARLESCLAYYLFRPESIAKRSPWAVMHAMLPFGTEAELVAGNQRVNAIGWMCHNGRCRTQTLFLPKSDSFSMAVGPGVQGHEGQLLAMLAQSYVPSSYPIQVDSRQYSVGDLVRYEMMGCQERTELTFKLIGLSHYLPSEQAWVTEDGKAWNISKIVAEELNQPIVGAACGGTHRLMGLTYSVKRRQEEGLPIDGNFLRAEQFVNDFVQYAWTLQNSDGSFSTNWFESRGDEQDLDRKVQTTGHILEWLIYTIPDERLDDAKVVRALNFLLSQIWERRDHDWAIGPRGHSLRALALYDQRRFGSKLGNQRARLSGYARSIRR